MSDELDSMAEEYASATWILFECHLMLPVITIPKAEDGESEGALR